MRRTLRLMGSASEPSIPLVRRLGSVAHTFAMATLVVSLPILASLPFMGAGHDDQWIMLFAGESLGHGPWFANHNGVPQEMSTSVLGALLAALASWLAPPDETYAAWKIASWLPAVLAAWGLFALLRRVVGSVSALLWLVVLCAVPQWHYWAWGGVESGLFWLASLAFVASLAHFTAAPSTSSAAVLTVIASLLPLVRADALWAPLVLLAFAVVRRGARPAFSWAPAVVAIAATLAFHVVRRLMTGAWLPNPAYAKAPISSTSVGWGLQYLAEFHAGSSMHAALGLAIPVSAWCVYQLWRSRHDDVQAHVRLLQWTGVIVLVIDATTVLVGGDWMPYHRFAARTLHLKVLVLALAFEAAFRHATERRWLSGRRWPYGLGLVLLAMTGLPASGVVSQPYAKRHGVPSLPDAELRPWRGLSDYMLRRNRAGLRELDGIAPWVRDELPRLVSDARRAGRLPVIAASYQAGFFPREVRRYFTVDEVLFVDLVGLSDHRIAKLPGPRSPHGLMDGAYFWAETIASQQGGLGQFVARCRPDVLYVLGTSPRHTELMRRAGYRLAHTRTIRIEDTEMPSVVIFESERAGGHGCAALSR